MTRLHLCPGTAVLSPTGPVAVFRCSAGALSCTCAADALRMVRLALYQAAADDLFAHESSTWWVQRLDGVVLSASRRGEGVLRRLYRTRAREVREAKGCA